MNPNRWAILLVSCLVALIPLGSTWAAGSSTSILKQHRVVGAYRLSLQIGPVHTMGNMSSGMSVGGKSATCRMPGRGTARSPKTCNRYIGVNVADAKTNKVEIRARVAITLRDTHKHTTIAVPIMMMLGSGGVHDFQYGNNIAATAGAYTVAVTVNSVHTTFQVKLT